MRKVNCLGTAFVALTLPSLFICQPTAQEAKADDLFEVRRILKDATLGAMAVEDIGFRGFLLQYIVRAQVRAGDLPGALNTASHFQNGARNDDRGLALQDIAIAQAERGDLKGALQTAAGIQDDEQRMEALRGIGFSRAKAGDIKGAHHAASLIRSSKAGRSISRDIAIGQGLAGDLPGALRTVRSIKDHAEREFALWDIAIIRSKTGDTKGALRIVLRIRDQGRRAAATADIAVGRAEATHIESGLQLAYSITDPSQKADALRCIGQVQAEKGKPAEAVRTLQNAHQAAKAVKDATVRGSLLHKIAVAQANAGEIRAALQTASEIEGWKEYTLELIAAAQARKGDIKGATDIAAVMQNDLMKDSTLLAIALAQAEAGDTSGSFDRVSAIQGDAMKPTAFRLVARARAKAGDRDAANLAFERAVHSADALKDGRARSEALGFIAEDQAVAGDIAAARRTIEMIQDSWKKGHTFRAVATVQANAGNPGEVLRWSADHSEAFFKGMILLGAAEAVLERIYPLQWPTGCREQQD
jgi:hypothetical protein